jgi:hypothetical protein
LGGLEVTPLIEKGYLLYEFGDDYKGIEFRSLRVYGLDLHSYEITRSHVDIE